MVSLLEIVVVWIKLLEWWALFDISSIEGVLHNNLLSIFVHFFVLHFCLPKLGCTSVLSGGFIQLRIELGSILLNNMLHLFKLLFRDFLISEQSRKLSLFVKNQEVKFLLRGMHFVGEITMWNWRNVWRSFDGFFLLIDYLQSYDFKWLFLNWVKVYDHVLTLNFLWHLCIFWKLNWIWRNFNCQYARVLLHFIFIAWTSYYIWINYDLVLGRMSYKQYSAHCSHEKNKSQQRK